MRQSVSVGFLLLLTFAGFAQKAGEWRLARDEDGVKIYLRAVEGVRTREVLGLTSMHATLGALVSMVKDPSCHALWIYANKEARFLKTISDFEWIYYDVSAAPWPVRNRDLITHAVMTQDSNSYAVRIVSDGWPDYIPPGKNLVRVPKLRSVWVFTPANDGIVDVRFELSIDLGGDIPAWLVNFGIDRGPFSTLVNMAKVVQTTRYKNKILPYIHEKKTARAVQPKTL
jgi:hypothetical protein